MKKFSLALTAAASLAVAFPASANLTITPYFASSITNDANAAAIEATIESAILVYENLFSNNIVVPITFGEGGGLGQSQFNLYDISYFQFTTALYNNAQATMNPNQLAAVAANPIATYNPVTGTNDILMKCASVDALFGAGYSGCASDGTILINTSVTNPGSSGSSGQYSLLATVEHEINEILGLGSTLGLAIGGYTCGLAGLTTACSNVPSPEDLFRYAADGTRSFASGNGKAYLSINGTVDLAQFNNTSNGADYGDWRSNPLPSGASPQVQDAFATPGAYPTLGSNEILALSLIGYDLVPTPEPGSAAVFAVATLGLLGMRRRPQRA